MTPPESIIRAREVIAGLLSRRPRESETRMCRGYVVSRSPVFFVPLVGSSSFLQKNIGICVCTRVRD